MSMTITSSLSALSHAGAFNLDPENNTPSIQKPKHAKLSRKRSHLQDVDAVDAEAMIKIPKLAVNHAMGHIKEPSADFGHKDVNSKRVLSDLGDSVFSVLFNPSSAKPINHPPEYNQHFMSLIEEIEKYMATIVAMPSNENELHEDMRKHKKFIQESMDELDFLEKYFGILKISRSAIINFKKLRPVVLEVDASGERF